MKVSISDQSSSPREDLVRDALLHLYDMGYLQTHPLATHIAVETKGVAFLRGKRLFQILLAAIEALRPATGAPADSVAWRSYRLLERRYIQGLPASEVADQLSISKTQYRRDHQRALQAIASIVEDRWNLLAPGEYSKDSARSLEPGSVDTLALAEVEGLTEQMKTEPIHLADFVASLLALIGPASAEGGILLSFDPGPGLPPIFADRSAVRQIFLGVLNMALEQSPIGTTVRISLEAGHSAITMRIVAVTEPHLMPKVPNEGPEPNLEVVRRLARALGGTIQIGHVPGIGYWNAAVTLPITHGPLLLVVDNHVDFVRLIERYLAEYGWEVIGSSDVDYALKLARERRPTVILLDVMIPGQDGWDLLLALRSHDFTDQIPVLVCSILREPHVARALGAAGYLQKPLTQLALLNALAPFRQRMAAPMRDNER